MYYIICTQYFRYKYLQTELDKRLEVWSHKSKLTLYHLVKQLHCLTRLTLVVGGTHHEMRRERREDDFFID